MEHIDVDLFKVVNLWSFEEQWNGARREVLDMTASYDKFIHKYLVSGDNVDLICDAPNKIPTLAEISIINLVKTVGFMG